METPRPASETAAYLRGVRRRSDGIPDTARFPFDLPFVPGLDLEFRSGVVFLVGETGSGKSTVLEAIAALSGLPETGGGKNELADRHGLQETSALAPALRPSWVERPRDAYFFRADSSSTVDASI